VRPEKAGFTIHCHGVERTACPVGEQQRGGEPQTHTNSQKQSVQWAGRRCLLAIYRSCAAGYDGRASAFALLQRDKAARPYRLGNVPIIIRKWYQCLQEPFQILFWTVVFSFRQQTFTATNPDGHG